MSFAVFRLTVYTLERMAAENNNIKASGPGSLVWKPDDLDASLTALRDYVELEAAKAIDWYWRNKKWKSFLSRAIQLSAIALTALGGLVPIVVQILKSYSIAVTIESGLFASLCVGLAAALLGLNKAFGFSSGWARFVLTATSIRKAMEEFRMDWTAMTAKLNSPADPAQAEALIQRARDFRLNVEGLVFQETKDWVTEFQSNFAQLEKEAKVQLDALKVQVEKAAQARATESQVGAMEATVANADKTDKFTFQVSLEGGSGKVAEETVVNSRNWVRINLRPGQYKLSVSAKVGGSPLVSAMVVHVKPGEVTRPEITLSV